MTLDRLALSRSTLDRAAHRRGEPGLIGSLLARPSTAVLVLDGDRTPVLDSPRGPLLHLLDPPAASRWLEPPGATAPATPLALYLGERAEVDDDRRAYLALVVGAPDQPRRPAPDGSRWAGLREVGALLDDTAAGVLTAAVALAHWHHGHPRCARCGAATEVIQAGWARSCPACGAEHYPRTDGAVIMAVVDDRERILLGRQARWPQRRFSCLAGFVEPGESLEAAVRREVREEAGVEVGQVSYRGSQPWPFPASLMLGFRARALTTRIDVDGAELMAARWWTREELSLDIATGELLLPPPVSIARRLIEEWHGGVIRDGDDTWR